MRKALVVGINNYQEVASLYGCVNDALWVQNVLARHSDGSVNFGIMPLVTESTDEVITKDTLRNHIESLFKDKNEIALLYFSGHGCVDSTGGYIVTSECKTPSDGIPLNDIMIWVNKSPATNKIIILDSCNSGIAGNISTETNTVQLAEGVTILTASAADQYATEQNGRGVFTELFVDALNGAASNLVGDVSPGSIYAHIDQSLGPWAQRPVFKTNVKNFVSLRKVQPPITLAELQKLSTFFPLPGYVFPLDPTFEPERNGGEPEGTPEPKIENTIQFATLQNYNRVNLVVPVDAPHMWHAAMHSKGCKLTVLGEHYRRLAESSLL